MNNIDINNFNPEIFNLWKNQWLLITSGDFTKKDFNTMTVAWGSIGIMWNKPFVQIVVRPTRFTYKFTEKYNTFSLTAFPEKYKSALQILGTKSGRDSNKIEDAGLTPIPCKKIESPGFKEADLVIECNKVYYDDFKPDNFLSDDIEKSYPLKDYHRIYFGEVLNISGADKYAKPIL